MRIKKSILTLVSIVMLFMSNSWPDHATPWANALAVRLNGQYASQLFPYTYVPSDHIPDGWTREPGIIKVTGAPGPMLRIVQDATVEADRMLGFTYPAPPGKKIIRVDFRYDASYDLNILIAGLGYPGKALHWCVSSLGAYRFVSVNVPEVDQVHFGFFVSQTRKIPFADWHFRVRDVRIYFSDNDDSPMYSGRLRVSPQMGGALTYLEMDDNNMVDVSDCGRLIQISLGDGSTNPNGQKWNPTQACDAQASCGGPCGGQGNYTGATQVIMDDYDVTPSYGDAWEINGVNTTIVSDKLVDWGGIGKSEYTVKQTITSITQSQYSDIYLVEYEVTNSGDSHDGQISFEFPAVYMPSHLTDRFVAYVGSQPWQSQPVTEWPDDGTPNPFPLCPVGEGNGHVRTCPSENWVALVNDNHDGVIVYWPNQTLYAGAVDVGFVLEFNPHGAIDTDYFAINYVHGLLPGGHTLKYHVYLASGHLEAIRPLLEGLP
jgi:hypothetical protein